MRLALVEISGPTAASRRGRGPGSPQDTSTYTLAAWTARPTSADPAQTSAAETHCSASGGQVGANQPGTGGKQGPAPAGGAWNPVIIDPRGDLTLVPYGDGSATMACLASPSFVWLNPIDPSTGQSVSDTAATLDEVAIRGAGSDVYTIAIGRAGSIVTAVGRQLVDRSVVTATVSDGRFVAWWPESEGVTALSVTTNTGTRDYPVDQRFAPVDPPTEQQDSSLAPRPADRQGRLRAHDRCCWPPTGGRCWPPAGRS